ncbi:MAG: Phosphoesterase PA-phosphatase related protein [Candidatus Gallionella acididurans]|uniref:Phosphoesterase PA-phosphatase related protein n=1 Tax=Candidatus Gallionella acididurans TaxID=1796491 RepID=A0A139BR55_9PROT|nr:MAG: Phosphoesterase PA-phosphatase related protein [Candidatus Gallionella acididurans]
MKEVLYDWGGANVWLFHVINDIRFVWLDKVMLLGTELGDHTLFPFYLGLLTLCALAVAETPGQEPAHYRLQVTRWMAVIAVFSCAYLLDGLLLAVLKPALDFPRPPLALPPGTVQIVGTPEYHHSLPSGHSSFAMLVTASLWPVLKRGWRVAGVIFVLWVGVSRISLGAHFPADVMAGFLSSLAVVMLVYVAIQKLMQVIGKRANRFRRVN